MGHYFVYSDSNKVIGINNGGHVLVARRDRIDPVLQTISEVVRSRVAGNDPLGFAKSVAYSFTYPGKYISKFEAKRNFEIAFDFEEKVFEVFRRELYSSYVNFRVSDVADKINEEIIYSVLKIFLSNDSKIDFEIISNGTTLRIFSRPSSISTFFTGNRSGETQGSCLLRSITDIEITEKQISFYNKRSNFMSLTRERCYT
jgi:hypothetical protein